METVVDEPWCSPGSHLVYLQVPPLLLTPCMIHIHLAPIFALLARLSLPSMRALFFVPGNPAAGTCGLTHRDGDCAYSLGNCHLGTVLVNPALVCSLREVHYGM